MMLSSCDLDINDNPNSPSNSDVTADLVFPAIENSIATAVGDQMFNYAGFFAQYWDQMPTANQYNTLAELDLDEGSDLFNRCYSNLYAQALEDVEDVLSKTENTSDIFAAKVLRAQALYTEDANKPVRKSHENASVMSLYKDYLGEPNSHKAHELLHTTYVKRPKYTK